MIIDSCAIIAVLTGEPEHGAIVTRLAEFSTCAVSAATVLECALVLGGKARRNEVNLQIPQDIFGLLDRIEAEIIPVYLPQLTLALEAARRFGKGSGHPAQLNFGDCFSYALAMHLKEPLLFKGNDFTHTDVQQVPLS